MVVAETNHETAPEYCRVIWPVRSTVPSRDVESGLLRLAVRNGAECRKRTRKGARMECDTNSRAIGRACGLRAA